MKLLKYKAYIREYDVVAEVEQLELLPNGKVQSIVVSDWELTDEVYSFTQGQFALMEFTGYIDSADNEVYSGQIIECDPKRNVKVLQGFRGVVVWGDTYKTYGIEHPTEAFCPLWHLDGFKIIGNIYQDKELLNG
nr:MAG TPA: YopX protein [Caudoviricetes sp.]